MTHGATRRDDPGRSDSDLAPMIEDAFRTLPGLRSMMDQVGTGIEELCLDISDLFIYTFYHRNVSGIQRVQSNIAYELLKPKSDDAGPITTFVYYELSTGSVRRIQGESLQDYITKIRLTDTSHDDIREAILTIKEGSSDWAAHDRAVYVVTGAFWMFSNVDLLYNKLKRSGCIVGCLVYDLIPISYPEFCAADLVSSFKASMDSGLRFFDLIITISEYTAQEVRKYIIQHSRRTCVVAAVPLAHTIYDRPTGSKQQIGDLDGLIFNDYVLCVGTIEARKNHAYLFQVWKLLIESGRQKIPKLVFVGRWGWRVADLKQQLEATDFLAGHIINLAEVDDDLLEVLYRNCLFTIMPSFVEGWGLPVGESLAYGKLCLASHTSSIPEVGGHYVDYIDPYNARQGCLKILKMLDDREAIHRREIDIRNNFQLRNWSSVAVDFVSAVFAAVAHPAFAAGAALEFDLRVGSVVEAKSERELGRSGVWPESSPFESGWHAAEDFGRWIDARHARLRFRLVEPSPRDKMLKLDLLTAPWAARNWVEVTINHESHTHPVPRGERFVLVQPFKHDLNDIVECSLTIGGDIDASHDERGLSIGIERFVVMEQGCS